MTTDDQALAVYSCTTDPRGRPKSTATLTSQPTSRTIRRSAGGAAGKERTKDDDDRRSSLGSLLEYAGPTRTAEVDGDVSCLIDEEDNLRKRRRRRRQGKNKDEAAVRKAALNSMENSAHEGVN